MMQRLTIVSLLCLQVATIAVCFIVLSHGVPAIAVVLTTSALALTLGYFIFRNSNTALPALAAALLLSLAFESVLPDIVSFVVELAVLIYGFLWWSRARTGSTLETKIALLVLILFFYWFLLGALHPNVPSLYAGAVGWRKAVLPLGGIFMGMAARSTLRVKLERAVVGVLGSALAASVLLHIYFPSLESEVSRGADVYTSLIAGQARLQGVFSGPFHIALASLVVLAWAMVRIRRFPFLGLSLATVGAIALYLSLVRTGFVAVGVLVAIYVLVQGGSSRRLARFMAATAVATGAYFVFVSTPESVLILESLGGASSDSRLLNRFPGYEAALDLVADSPIFGWGAGSAGDTIAQLFVGSVHLTPHNILLKMLFEGGIIGLAIFATLVVTLLSNLLKGGEAGKSGLMALTALLVMGLTGSAIEAMPVAYFVFVLVGCGLPSDVGLTKGHEVEPEDYIAFPALSGRG